MFNFLQLVLLWSKNDDTQRQKKITTFLIFLFKIESIILLKVKVYNIISNIPLNILSGTVY